MKSLKKRVLQLKILKLSKKNMQFFFIILFTCSLFLSATVLICNYLIINHGKPYIYSQIDSLPYNKTGLVLGTVKILDNGNINLYFKYRIDATVALYENNKIEYIIVSGDNSRKGYNEPLQMKQELLGRGIPESVIYLDYAGFRTLDSVVRCKEVFKQNNFTIISQKFHNERAIYIARKKNIKAIAYNAKDVTISYGFKTRMREALAKVKAFLDIHILRKKPKFLGKSIQVG